MKNLIWLAVIVAVGLLLSGCPKSEEATDPAPAPVVIEKVVEVEVEKDGVMEVADCLCCLSPEERAKYIEDLCDPCTEACNPCNNCNSRCPCKKGR